MSAQRSLLLVMSMMTAVAALSMTGCGKSDNGKPTGKTEAPPTRVNVATLESTTFSDTLSVYGRLEAENAVRITAEVAGRIESVPFKEGQAVSRGQTLLRINARMAKAQLDQAAAQDRLAASTLERLRKLAKKNLATPQQLEQAEAQAASAKAGHELAKVSYGKAVIRAPFAGKVTNITAKRGEVAGPGQPLLQLVDARQINVVAGIAEQDIAYIQKGADVNVRIDAFGERLFTGKVTEIALAADPRTRTFPIKVALKNDDGVLRPGMLASVQVTRQVLNDAIAVPVDAVIEDLDGRAAFVIEGNKAVRKRVTLGPVRGRYVVATSGLSAGEKLVTIGHRQIVTGQQVEIGQTTACCTQQIGGTASTDLPTERPTKK